jgi:mono/diheme cytochrome c family protein
VLTEPLRDTIVAPLRPALAALVALACAPSGCADDAPATATIPLRYWGSAPAPHASTLALTPDARELVAVQPDSDAVSFVDVDARAITREIPLGPTPAPDAEGRWVSPVYPVALSLAPHRRVAYVVGRNDGDLFALDLDARSVIRRAHVCTEPSSVLVGPGEARVFVACAPDREVLSVDPVTLQTLARAAVPHETGALALHDDGGGVYVTHPRTGGVTLLDAATLAVRSRGAVPEAPYRGHPIRAHGLPRALTDLAMRPATRELWTLHTLLSAQNAQPTLNFESTVFPAVSALDADAPDRGLARPLMTTDARLADVDGAFAHIVSGPRALAFTPDGAFALMVNLNSESLTVIDCARGVETGYVEDLPGALHDGIAISPDGARAWINARNTGTVVPLTVSPRGAVAYDGAPFTSRSSDPMPRALRTGQWMFHNANDHYQAFPITVNRWLSCESCHMGGGGAAVTQRMLQGPRDIPDLRAGYDGFLMRTATRRGVRDFWRTIALEQGGSIRPDDDLFGPPFEALAQYVERALPPAFAPRTDAALAARGGALFERADVGCARCHGGPRLTDSGAGNPSLDLAGEVRLYDVGTCDAAGAWPDRAHDDIAGHARDACRFDTPSLRSVARSGPWLHDGSAATLRDVLTSRNAGGLHGSTARLSEADLDALVEYLRSL